MGIDDMFCPNCDSGNVEFVEIEEGDDFGRPVFREVYRCEVCGFRGLKRCFVMVFEEDHEE